MAKAQSNLKVAAWAYGDGEYDPCVSRAYYAVFHAAIAALLKLSDYRPKVRKGRLVWDHDGVASEFNRRLIRQRKLLSADLGSIPQELVHRRHEADYYAVQISRPIARQSLDKARQFVEAVKGKL